jgi:hypothetical protein
VVVGHLNYSLSLWSHLVFDSFSLGLVKCAPSFLLRFYDTILFLLCHPSVTVGVGRVPVKERMLRL